MRESFRPLALRRNYRRLRCRALHSSDKRDVDGRTSRKQSIFKSETLSFRRLHGSQDWGIRLRVLFTFVAGSVIVLDCFGTDWESCHVWYEMRTLQIARLRSLTTLK